MLGLFGRTVFHMHPTKCLRTRHTSVTGPTSLPFQLIGPLSTPSDCIRHFIPFSLSRMLKHPPLSSSFRSAVVHIGRLHTHHAFVTSSTLIHSQLLCTPSHAAGWLQPPLPTHHDHTLLFHDLWLLRSHRRQPQQRPAALSVRQRVGLHELTPYPRPGVHVQPKRCLPSRQHDRLLDRESVLSTTRGLPSCRHRDSRVRADSWRPIFSCIC